MGYKEALKTYFEHNVRDWINNNVQSINAQASGVKGQTAQQAGIFQEYVKLAQSRGDNYLNPAKIVTNVNLCWDLEELVNLKRQKRRIMNTFKRKAQEARAGQSSQFWTLDHETEAKLNTLSRAEVEISNKFIDKNESGELVIGRFLGKAFVSF